eukprot:CAMPEP_0114245928 /NCGR_PEP_ID=MMETSP0058-20121206/12173_1 /TAXON_ID=36894 /ORGANISM="Pyramimonas parkeae, CCMP726" /LENGTH=199 /DNA_ID=CAMNT_0001359045 /DNA_START=356 /DNA_END=955 /DNA_ORIENTATION=-
MGMHTNEFHEQDEENDEEILALQAALRMNEELKAMEAAMDKRADLTSVSQSYCKGASRTRHASPVKRTFTSAPDSTRVAMHARPKADYTHSRGRLHDIARQNHALASKLQTISLTPSSSAPAAAHVPQYLKVASVAPAAINRKKKQTNIEKENARLLARLQSVKPDKSLNSKKLAQDHQLHQKFSQNCRKVKLRPEWQE